MRSWQVLTYKEHAEACGLLVAGVGEGAAAVVILQEGVDAALAQHLGDLRHTKQG